MKKLAAFVCFFGFMAQAASADMVMTPAGYRDRAMVHVLQPGQSLRKRNGRFEIVNTVTQSIVETDTPVGGTTTPIDDSGWITYSVWQVPGGDSLLSFASTWIVPPIPVNQDNQLLYFFNGLSNLSQTTILQPVLQWGVSPSGGGTYWAVASWYVTSDGQAFSTAPIPVQPGQVLSGVMTNITGAGGGTPSYTSQFVGIPGTLLTAISIEELRNAYETLEVYGVDTCSDYPAGDTAFTGINIQTTSGNPALTWTAQNKVLDCGQHTNVISNSPAGGEVDLHYGN